MKRNRDFLSFIMTVIIILLLFIAILVSLDFCGIITLPEKFSLKTYLSSVSVYSSSTEDEIYYPDYEATGSTVTQDSQEIEENSSSSDRSSLSEYINVDNNNENSSNSSNEENNSETYDVTDNSYYYNQLDVYGKTIYSKLYSSLDEMKTGTATINFGTTFNELLNTSGGDETLNNAFQLAINALLLDHPEIFYLDITKVYMFTETTTTLTGTTYRISIGPEDENSNYLAEGFSQESDVLYAEQQLKIVLESITSNLSGNTANKIKQVHNYLIDNTSYDSEGISELSHEIYGTLINHLGVCDGYAKSFKYILDYIGISCIEVCGIGQNSNGEIENHAWNDVLVNGTWYAIDVTWDDPIIINGNGTITDELRYANYLKGSSTFYQNHTEDGNIVNSGIFTYPTLSYSDY